MAPPAPPKHPETFIRPSGDRPLECFAQKNFWIPHPSTDPWANTHRTSQKTVILVLLPNWHGNGSLSPAKATRSIYILIGPSGNRPRCFAHIFFWSPYPPRSMVTLSEICKRSVFPVVSSVWLVKWYWHRNMPSELIGAKVKFMIQVIPMIIAVVWHHLLLSNMPTSLYWYRQAAPTYLYMFAHFLHTTYDIGGIDVLLGLIMQVLAYMLDVVFLVRTLVLNIWLGFSFYISITYFAPEVPAHRKKESALLPCWFQGTN